MLFEAITGTKMFHGADLQEKKVNFFAVCLKKIFKKKTLNLFSQISKKLLFIF